MDLVSSKSKSEIESFLVNLCLELRVNYSDLTIYYSYSEDEDWSVVTIGDENNGINELRSYFNSSELTVIISPEEVDINDAINDPESIKGFLTKYGRSDLIKDYEAICEKGENDDETYSLFESFNNELTGIKLNRFVLLNAVETRNF